MKIMDLFAEIGFKFDSLKLKEVSKLIGDLNISSVVSATSLAALGNQIRKVMEDADKSTQSVLNFTEATGLDPTSVQQFKVYAQEFGASAEEAEQALYNLNKLRLEVLQGKGNPQPFILTGLVPTTDTLKLLDEIHAKFSDTSFLERWAGSFAKNAKSVKEMQAAWKDTIANQFGFSTALLRTLDSTNEEWAKMKNIIALTNPEMARIAESHKEWTLAVNQFNLEMQKSVSILLPAFAEVLRSINESGAFQRFANNLVQIMNAFEIIGTRWKAFTMEGDMAIAKAVNSFVKPGNISQAFSNGQTNKTIEKSNQTNITVHVTSNSPEDFVKHFERVWKRRFGDADLQFGQQT